MRKPFKLKYTNGKKSDSSVFPFKSSPLKGFFEDAFKSGGGMKSAVREMRRRKQEELDRRTRDIDPWAKKERPGQGWRSSMYAQNVGEDTGLTTAQSTESGGPPPEPPPSDEEIAQMAQGDISSKEEQPIVQNVAPKTII